MGSPPHVRGKVLNYFICIIVLRITPACAGKRCRSFPRLKRLWDHPRMCGEKHQRVKFPCLLGGSPPHVRGKGFLESRKDPEKGSPPHVRGKVREEFFQHINQRITPACAGKSFVSKEKVDESLDHPRMCGEKFKFSFWDISLHGSPPHVRGKEKSEERNTDMERITPACAGKRKTGLYRSMVY